jgi:hypothetical protein
MGVSQALNAKNLLLLTRRTDSGLAERLIGS